MGKARIDEYIEKHRTDIENMALDIWTHPEGGFQEHRTADMQSEY